MIPVRNTQNRTVGGGGGKDKMEKKKKSIARKILMAIGIIAVILIIAAAGVFLYIRRMMTANTPKITIGEAADETIVETSGGSVRGYLSNSVYTYHGIPYADAPERFVEAQPVKKWDGIRDTTEYGPISPQGSLFGSNTGAAENTDNNCLNLNLWTPGLDGNRRPVMVWFHGGGFSTGSGNDAMYDGEALAAFGDVVVVSVNHRLNTFGYLDLSAYGEKYQNGGNQGVTDMVAALEWVQGNIEGFGGDPDNVTIFGQSGGGAKVLALMTTPYAKGLFTRGIVQSGATDTMGLTFATKEQSLALTEHILEKLGIDESNIEDIQTVEESALQDAANEALGVTGNEYQIPAALGDGYNMEWGPVVDGEYLPTNPVTEDGFAEVGKDVTLMIGSNLNEWAMAGQTPSGDQITEEVTAAFAEAYPGEDADEVKDFDTLLRYPLLKITRHKAMQQGADVYSYIFTMDDGQGGAYHTAEIPYVFHHVADDTLCDQMSELWVSFARNGVPRAEGIEEWRPYTLENGEEMILDRQSYLSRNHDLKLLHLLKPDYDLD